MKTGNNLKISPYFDKGTPKPWKTRYFLVPVTNGALRLVSLLIMAATLHFT